MLSMKVGVAASTYLTQLADVDTVGKRLPYVDTEWQV
jgi:hypothetical protein